MIILFQAYILNKKKIITSKRSMAGKKNSNSINSMHSNQLLFSLVFTQFSSFTSFKNKIKNLNQILKSLYPYAHSRIKVILQGNRIFELASSIIFPQPHSLPQSSTRYAPPHTHSGFKRQPSLTVTRKIIGFHYTAESSIDEDR